MMRKIVRLAIAAFALAAAIALAAPASATDSSTQGPAGCCYEAG